MGAPTGDAVPHASPTALHGRETWNHNNHYHAYLLRNLPEKCGTALDVGCGAGAFARLLSGRADYVLGIDISPDSVRIARERSQGYTNISFAIADATAYPLADAGFDCIVSIAALHHMPAEETYARFKRALRPGGTLVVLDLYQQVGLHDRLADVVAVPAHHVLSLLNNGWGRESIAQRRARVAHLKADRYLTLSQVHRIAQDLLPGAAVRRHLFWRYSVVWKADSDCVAPRGVL